MDDLKEIPDPEIGEVQWHSSDEDGGPDVGILLGLGGDKMLWVGEMLNAEGVGAMGMKVYEGQHTSHAMPFDYDSIREVIEEHIAPVVRTAADRISALEAQFAARDAEIVDWLREASGEHARIGAANEALLINGIATAIQAGAYKGATRND